MQAAFVYALASLVVALARAPSDAPKEPAAADTDGNTTEVEGPEPDPESLPVSLRETRAPKHADCDHRTPRWTHVVAVGEHLGLIAGRYGVRQRDLLRWNPGLANPDLIHPGDALVVCPEIAPRVQTLVEVTVGAGDTVSALANRHGLTVREFLAVQREPIADPHRIRPGQVLRFEVDGGIVDDFRLPLPEPPKAKGKDGRKKETRGSPRARADRVNVQLAARPHVHIKRPHLAFGTEKTVRLLERVVERYERRSRNGPRVLIGDISREGGGRLHPHLSHRTGQDVDVGYVLTGADALRTRFEGVDRDNLDLERTWTLVKAFLDTHEVLYIFMDYGVQAQLYEHARRHGSAERELDELFQYPRGRGRSHGIIRHWPHHRHHFHVRFRE